MDDNRKTLTTDSSKKKSSPSQGENILDKLAYCPTHLEVEEKSIKRYYITPKEISEIFDRVFFDE